MCPKFVLRIIDGNILLNIELVLISNIMEKIISYNGKLIVQELDKDFGESICHDILCDQGKSLLILLTTKGHLKLNIGHQDYLLEKQVLFTLFPIHPLEIIEVSSNYKGIAIKISREFLVNHSGDKGFYTINNMLRRQEDPCIFITIEEKYIILKKLQRLKTGLRTMNISFTVLSSEIPLKDLCWMSIILLCKNKRN